MRNKNIKIGFITYISLLVFTCFSPKLNASEEKRSDIVITSCGERETVINALRKDYKEVQDSIGISNGGGLIEVFVSPQGSFSITITNPSQITCIISAGEYWNKGNSLVSLDPKI
jgi:hypothetical protein